MLSCTKAWTKAWTKARDLVLWRGKRITKSWLKFLIGHSFKKLITREKHISGGRKNFNTALHDMKSFIKRKKLSKVQSARLWPSKSAEKWTSLRPLLSTPDNAVNTIWINSSRHTLIKYLVQTSSRQRSIHVENSNPSIWILMRALSCRPDLIDQITLKFEKLCGVALIARNLKK